MPILAGERLTAARLQRLQPVVYSATGTSNLTLSTTDTDVPGASIDLTTATDDAVLVVTGVFAFDVTSATTDYGEGKCFLDGAQVSGNVRWSGEVTTDFGTGTQVWHTTAGSAGAHTIKLRGSRGSTGGGIQLLGAFTRLAVTVYEVV